MFGKNEITKPRNPSDGFNVHSIFYTIQGEGPFAGKPALFVRLAGCNLRCVWCDTDFEKGSIYNASVLAEELYVRGKANNCAFVVLTGGEPLLQPLIQLIDHPRLITFKFQIETAGSIWPYTVGLTKSPLQNKNLSVVCSPKTPGVVTSLRSKHEYDVYWKYIVRAAEDVDPFDGLPRFSTQRVGEASVIFRPHKDMADRIYIQACDEGDPITNRANLHYAAQIAMKHGYRLSIQQHKIIGLD